MRISNNFLCVTQVQKLLAIKQFELLIIHARKFQTKLFKERETFLLEIFIPSIVEEELSENLLNWNLLLYKGWIKGKIYEIKESFSKRFFFNGTWRFKSREQNSQVTIYIHRQVIELNVIRVRLWNEVCCWKRGFKFFRCINTCC